MKRRGSQSARLARGPRDVGFDPRPAGADDPPRTAPVEDVRGHDARPAVAALALVPLRLFAGVTFLYAGVDKLLDPAFFDPSSSASIYAQMTAFTRVSPLAGLVRLGEPFALPLGLLIALAEIAIGVGALTGLAFRLAAAGGAALSLLFWLTASWATHPYYYGPDLPYAAGWLTLALAGDGGVLIPARVRAIGAPSVVRRGRRGFDRVPRLALAPEPSPERRALLQAGVLAVAALAVASVAAPLRLFRHETRAAGHGSAGSAAAGTAGLPSANSAPPAAQAPGASQTPGPASPSAGTARGGVAIARTADVQRTGAAAFVVPANAPSPLPAGDPGVVIRLGNGRFVAYDATCTHEGCTVEWDRRDAVLLCPCHGAAFDPSNDAAVLAGPTDTPLAALPIRVDEGSGTIYLGA